MPSEQAPPTIPTDLVELREAQVLCSQVAHKGTLSLNMYQRERLVHYCGRMPVSRKQALRWKLYIRALRKEVAAEEQGDE